MADIENTIDHEKKACCLFKSKKVDQTDEDGPEKKKTSLLVEFRDFILGGNLIRIGVAFILAVAIQGLIAAFVRAFVTPILGIIGARDIDELTFTVRGSVFRYGLFLDSLLSFLILCIVVFFVLILPVQRYAERCVPEWSTRSCPYCVSSIPTSATRCSSCTSEIEPVNIEPEPKKGE